jgi:hypothetical protein
MAFQRMFWMWKDSCVDIDRKLVLYTQFVQIAMYGAEAWKLDKRAKSRTKRWNARNLATMLPTAQDKERWMARYKEQLHRPSLQSNAVHPAKAMGSVMKCQASFNLSSELDIAIEDTCCR